MLANPLLTSLSSPLKKINDYLLLNPVPNWQRLREHFCCPAITTTSSGSPTPSPPSGTLHPISLSLSIENPTEQHRTMKASMALWRPRRDTVNPPTVASDLFFPSSLFLFLSFPLSRLVFHFPCRNHPDLLPVRFTIPQTN